MMDILDFVSSMKICIYVKCCVDAIVLTRQKTLVSNFSWIFVIYAPYVSIGECYCLYDSNLLDVYNKAQIKILTDFVRGFFKRRIG